MFRLWSAAPPGQILLPKTRCPRFLDPSPSTVIWRLTPQEVPCSVYYLMNPDATIFYLFHNSRQPSNHHPSRSRLSLNLPLPRLQRLWCSCPCPASLWSWSICWSYCRITGWRRFTATCPWVQGMWIPVSGLGHHWGFSRDGWDQPQLWDWVFFSSRLWAFILPSSKYWLLVWSHKCNAPRFKNTEQYPQTEG